MRWWLEILAVIFAYFVGVTVLTALFQSWVTFVGVLIASVIGMVVLRNHDSIAKGIGSGVVAMLIWGAIGLFAAISNE